MRRSTVGVLISSALVLASGNTATAGPAPGAAAVQWSAAHGASTASGTRWTEPSGIGNALVVEGELRGTGAGCSSVWVQWTRDLAPGPYRVHATQCGDEVTPVRIRLDPYWPTTTGRLKVCRGTADMNDCGPSISLTSWPVGNAEKSSSSTPSPPR